MFVLNFPLIILTVLTLKSREVHFLVYASDDMEKRYSTYRTGISFIDVKIHKAMPLTVHPHGTIPIFTD